MFILRIWLLVTKEERKSWVCLLTWPLMLTCRDDEQGETLSEVELNDFTREGW